MSNKYNQFIQQQMRADQPDKYKLIKIASFLRTEYGLTVHREPILTFDKNDGHLVQFSSWLTEEQFNLYTIHVPDLLFFVGKVMWIIEIDGWIHNVKDKVMRKDEWRDADYKRAKLNVRVINEWDVMLKLGLKLERGATPEEVITEVRVVMKEII